MCSGVPSSSHTQKPPSNWRDRVIVQAPCRTTDHIARHGAHHSICAALRPTVRETSGHLLDGAECAVRRLGVHEYLAGAHTNAPLIPTAERASLAREALSIIHCRRGAEYSAR